MPKGNKYDATKPQDRYGDGEIDKYSNQGDYRISRSADSGPTPSSGPDSSMVAKNRQGIGLSPDDDAHLVTHDPDPSSGNDRLGN